MTTIRFHTNLDEAQGDVLRLNAPRMVSEGWPFGVAPQRGERVRFFFEKWDHVTKRMSEFCYELEVCGVTYFPSKDQVLVELHMPSIPARSIAESERVVATALLALKGGRP